LEEELGLEGNQFQLAVSILFGERPQRCWRAIVRSLGSFLSGTAIIDSGSSFNIVTYCIFEAPSNLIIKKMQPARYITVLVFAWGLVATFTAFVQNLAGLLACRLLLGFFEAGKFPLPDECVSLVGVSGRQ
jgi:hypothetical protein